MREQAVTVEVASIVQEVEDGLTALAKAKAVVTTDKDVLNGTPCIVGTRVPVHDIAEMLANGDAVAAILAAYPQLTSEMVDLAALYAEAYPRRGRPPATGGKRGLLLKSSRTLRLDDLPS